MVQSVIFNKEELYCSVGIPSDRQESLLPTDQILSTDCLFFFLDQTRHSAAVCRRSLERALLSVSAAAALIILLYTLHHTRRKNCPEL